MASLVADSVGALPQRARRPAPPGLRALPTPVALIRALSRRWLLAFALGATLAVIAGAAVWFLPVPPPPSNPVQDVVPPSPPADPKPNLGLLQQRLDHLLTQKEQELAQKEKELAQGEIEKVQHELTVVRSEQKSLRTQFTDVRNTLTTQVEERLSRDPVYQQLLKDRDKAAAAYRKYENTTKPEVFGAKELRELRDVEQKVADHRGRTVEAVTREQGGRLEERLAQLDGREAQLTEQVRHWEKVIESKSAPSKPQPEQPPDPVNLQNLIPQSTREPTPPREEKPSPSQTPTAGLLDAGFRMPLATAAGFTMFLMTLLGVSYGEFRSQRVCSEDDITDGLGLKVLGTLPRFPKGVKGRLKEPPPPQELPWRQGLYEAVDVARTMVLHAAEPEGLGIVMVTSAVEGEGKTSLASQFAASLARSGRNVLMVDGDLRNPGLHQLFSMSGEPGLCEVLRGEVGPDDVIKPTRLGRLWLAPAGTWTPLMAQALSPEGVRDLLGGWRGRFDCIVMDAAPVLSVADSLVLVQSADSVVFSALRDRSRMPQLYTAWQRLEMLNVRLLGVVYNGGHAQKSLYGRRPK